MKKFIYSLLVFLFFVQFSFAQRGNGQYQRMTPEQRVEQMAEHLGLDEAQKAKILKINEDFAEKTSGLRSEIRNADETKRKDLIASMRTTMKERDDKIREVLTPGQQEKYDAMLAKREEMRKQRMGNRPANKRGGTVRPGK